MILQDFNGSMAVSGLAPADLRNNDLLSPQCKPVAKQQDGTLILEAMTLGYYQDAPPGFPKGSNKILSFIYSLVLWF